MGLADVLQVVQAAPNARIVAVHLEAVNHCMLSRVGLRTGLERASVRSTVLIPRDGEEVRLA